MGVGDHEAHSGQAAGAHAPQEPGPERRILAVAHGETEDLAVAVRRDAGGHDDRLGHDVGALMRLDVGGVQEHVGELDVVQAPLSELGHRGVELAADARHLALGHAGVDAQGGDEIVDLARRHAMHERFHDHRPQRPVDAAAGLEQRREERTLPQLGDLKFDVAGFG